MRLATTLSFVLTVAASACASRVPRSNPDAPTYWCRKHLVGRGSTCEPVGPPRARHVQRVPVGSAPTTRSSKGKLRVRVPFAGGQLEAIGDPVEHPTRVVLAVRPVARLGPSPCAARFFRDGAALTTDEVVRRSDHEVLVTMPVAQLEGLQTSARFSAQLCGLELDLDPLGRQSLANFAARFREQRDAPPEATGSER